MKFIVRLMLATAGLTAALTFAWALAFMSWAHRHSQRQNQQPTHHYRELPAVDPATIARVK